MVEKLGMVHLSAGDLLRAERNREGSEFGYLGDERRLTYCHKPIYKRNRKKSLKYFQIDFLTQFSSLFLAS